MDAQLEKTARALNLDVEELRERGVLRAAAEIAARTRQLALKPPSSQMPFIALHLACLRYERAWGQTR